MSNVFLLSTTDEEAKNILLQKKTFELRRTRPKLMNKDDYVIIYVGAPIKALVGVLKIDSMIQKDELWALVRHEITLERFQTYCRNICIGIFFKEVWRLPKPITFKILQKQHFIPPRGFRLAQPKEIGLFLGFELK